MAQPVAAVAAALGYGWLGAYGSRAWLVRALGGGLLLTAGLLWLSTLFFSLQALSFFSIEGPGGFVVLGLSALALMFAIVLTPGVVATRALAQRGETVRCTVLDVEERQETTTQTNADGSGSTSTTYYYDHALRCPGDYPEEVTTVVTPWADAGDRTHVTFDPRRQLNPQFGRIDAPRGLWAWAPAILLVVCLALRASPWIWARGRDRPEIIWID